MTGEKILRSHVACLLTHKFLCVTTSAFRDRGWWETLPPPHLKVNINSAITLINCAMFPENKMGTCFFPLSTIKKFHAEIVFEAWLGNLSGEVKIVYLLFLENSSRKCLILLLFYLPFFWLQISSAFAIIFAACHGLSCVHVRASWYTALFRVSLRGVWLKCVARGHWGALEIAKP